MLRDYRLFWIAAALLPHFGRASGSCSCALALTAVVLRESCMKYLVLILSWGALAAGFAYGDTPDALPTVAIVVPEMVKS